MSCDIANGRLEACKDAISGLLNIYFTLLPNISLTSNSRAISLRYVRVYSGALGLTFFVTFRGIVMYVIYSEENKKIN